MLAKFATHAKPIGLAALGLGCVLRGSMLLLPQHLTAPLRVLTFNHFIPIWVWGAVWAIVGVAAVGAAVVRHHERLVTNMVGGLLLTWSLAYLGALLIGWSDVSALLAAGTLLSFGVMVLAWTHLVDPLSPPAPVRLRRRGD